MTGAVEAPVMKRVCVVQARMGSTRLPGKVLRDLVGRPMLARQLERLATCRSLDEIVIATSTDSADDPIARMASGMGIDVVRGSNDDVLARVVQAARETRADVVVRVTADCPLIDPSITDRVVDELTTHQESCDYASNVVRRTYPRGLDVEALFVDTLQRLDRLAQTAEEREHVTITIRSGQPGIFLVRSVEDAADNSDLRWTVDEQRDFMLVHRLYEELDLGRVIAPYPEILQYVRDHPELVRLNQDVATWSPPIAADLPHGRQGAR